VIVSHKYKFIFWKPYKVAGSSIIQALGKQCGEDDIVGSPHELEGLPDYSKNMPTITGRRLPLASAAIPYMIRSAVGAEVFDSYFKFTIVRNPWDCTVSEYWNYWVHDQLPSVDPPAPDITNQDFLDHFNFGVRPMANSRYKNRRIFCRNRRYWCAWQPDYFLKFEKLNEGYQYICNKFDIPVEPLPHMKKQYRRDTSHYSKYYTKETRGIVESHYRDIIKTCKYTYEEKEGI
jgi:hypothetical protein